MAVRQLAERQGDGIVVELFWNDSEGQVFVEYSDERRDVYYTIYPDLARALEAYYHPNAFLAEVDQVAFVLRSAA
jgi:hypothetical protein